MTTDRASANGIDICYESFGSTDDPALLLIMGLGVQLTEWEPEFCMQFAKRGFRVLRYDNRDVGLSTRFDGHHPDVAAIMSGDRSSAAYTLADMAADAVGLLDALGIEQAHVVGASMGGMIAQTLAIDHPDRILSLCSIMSSTGAPKVGTASREVRVALTRPRPTDRAEVIETAVSFSRMVAGGGYPFDEARARQRIAAAFDRAFYPEGRERHMAAVAASGDRTEALGRVRVPTVVIHGDSDPLVNITGGVATAAAIRGAELVVIPGMGHEFPIGVRTRIVEAVATNAAAASQPAGGAT